MIAPGGQAARSCARQATLAALLRTEYGLEADEIRPGERGSVADTYVVRTSGATYFAKFIPISRYSANIERGLPLQKALHDHGLREMSYPIATTTGSLSLQLATDILVVYDYIDAEWTKEFPFEPFVDLIARVHASDIKLPANRETFLDTGLPAFERARDEIMGAWTLDPQLQLRGALLKLDAELDGQMRDHRRLLSTLPDPADLPMVITHNDAPGNILRDADGQIFLIDWDEVMYAPRERDTWFHLTTDDDAARFLARYRMVFPEYEVDRRLYAFYLRKRYFEDMEGALHGVMSADTSEEDKVAAVGSFHGDLARWQPAVRALSRS